MFNEVRVVLGMHHTMYRAMVEFGLARNTTKGIEPWDQSKLVARIRISLPT